MKVLMFGWEFPPHLSGGLGTACYGLTHSLVDERVDVLYVIPKLFGDEPQSAVQLISASEIKKTAHKVETLEKEFSESTDSLTVPEEIEAQVAKKTLSYQYTPYGNVVEVESLSYEIEKWNYQFPAGSNKSMIETITRRVKSSSVPEYNFTGGYGSNLMEEVFRYADVASTLAEKNDFDVIHVHDWMTIPAGINVKKLTGKPLIVHIHSTEYDRSGENINRFLFDIEKSGMEAADKIISVSQWTKEIIINRYDIPAEKIIVIHNGVVLEESNIKPGVRPIGSHIVTFLGRVTHQKGPHYFVNAARDVIAEFPDAHFIIAGSGDLLPLIIERVAQLKLSSHFHFTGFLNKKQIAKLLSYTDVYVMPSVSEPFGITPLEAMQAGVPSIISNQAGVGEVISHAIKVDFWNTQSLAHTICSVLRYDSLSNTLKKNGKKELKEITWEKAAKKINKLYHESTTEN